MAVVGAAAVGLGLYTEKGAVKPDVAVVAHHKKRSLRHGRHVQ